MHKTNWTHQTYFKPVELIKATHNLQLCKLQEVMESVAFPDKINLKSTEILRKCSKLYFFSLESLEYSFLCFGLVLKEKCMNQKAKPHKQSLVVGGQNGIRVLGVCRFATQEFGL